MPNLLALSSFLAALLASASGSLHCIVMCGPIRLVCNNNKFTRIQYQAGRALGYTMLGTAAGSIGFFVPTYLLILILILGLFLALAPIKKIPYWPRLRQKILHFASVNPLLLGLSSALLPCGLLHGWIAAAAVAGTPWSGAMLLFALWLGTVPALEFIGFFQKPMNKLREKFPRAVPIAFLIFAIIPIGMRYSILNFSQKRETCHVQQEIPAANHQYTEAEKAITK